MKNEKEESELQKLLVAYECPECNASQLITKPHPKSDVNGGCLVYTGIVICKNEKCNCKRKVRRYPNGTYRSFRV